MGALCPNSKSSPVTSNPCVQLEEQLLLLPIVEVTASYNNITRRFNCLMDTGSQRSYLSSGVCNMFNCSLDGLNGKELVIKTFIGAIK